MWEGDSKLIDSLTKDLTHMVFHERVAHIVLFLRLP